MLWSAPDRPRDVDADIVRDDPDVQSWLATLDSHRGEGEDGSGRLGLHGRVESQLVAGEPVLVVGHDPSGRWAEVRALWQLSPKDPRGYPGWVPAAHLGPVPPPDVELRGPEQRAASKADSVVTFARQHLGVGYLWGGISEIGFDCSGLVHQAWRQLGVLVPRDAHAQAEAAAPVDLDAVEAGDLYFFARPGHRIHHVGIVVSPGWMVHAPETGRLLVEEPLSPERVATLAGAGRLPYQERPSNSVAGSKPSAR